MAFSLSFVNKEDAMEFCSVYREYNELVQRSQALSEEVVRNSREIKAYDIVGKTVRDIPDPSLYKPVGRFFLRFRKEEIEGDIEKKKETIRHALTILDKTLKEKQMQVETIKERLNALVKTDKTS